MQLPPELALVLSKKLMPLYYKSLSRILPEKVFDVIFNLYFSNYQIPKAHKIEKNSRHFFFNADEKEEYLNIINKYYPETIDKTLQKADQILDHIFDLLGSGPTKLGSTIDWHTDFKSGFCWKPKFYKKIQTIRINDNSDIKLVWELSRFQHFSSIGQAYWITGNEKYAREFINQLFDWINSNQPRFGANWCNTMEVALRLINWVSAYFFFKNSSLFTNQMKNEFFRSVLIHLIYIYHNLEFGYRIKNDGEDRYINDNHYLADLIGLTISCLIFPNLIKKSMGKTAIQYFQGEVCNQVNPDGVHYELSIGYHRLVTEMLLSLIIIMKKNKIQPPSQMVDCANKMLEFVVSYIRPDSTAPQVRDSDDGRLITFSENATDDHSYLLNIGAVLFNRHEFKAAFPSFIYEALWWVGPEGFYKFRKLKNVNLQPSSQSFPKSGFYFMKKKDDCLMAITAGVGMNGFGGHGHNDILSFELITKGKKVIVDPGTYVYSANTNLRNLFRSTEYHNTIRIDGEEINGLIPNLIFNLSEEAFPKTEKWISKKSYDILVASHSGFKKVPGNIIHRRIILFNKLQRYWKISDHLFGSKIHTIEFFFHFAHGLLPEMDINNRTIKLRNSDGIICELCLKKFENFVIDFKKGWVSPSYGIKKRAWIACCTGLIKLPVKTMFTLEPRE